MINSQSYSSQNVIMKLSDVIPRVKSQTCTAGNQFPLPRIMRKLRRRVGRRQKEHEGRAWPAEMNASTHLFRECPHQCTCAPHPPPSLVTLSADVKIMAPFPISASNRNTLLQTHCICLVRSQTTGSTIKSQVVFKMTRRSACPQTPVFLPTKSTNTNFKAQVFALSKDQRWLRRAGGIYVSVEHLLTCPHRKHRTKLETGLI